MTIYVHIGYPKVASTSIQNFLAHNTRFLAKHIVIYPRVARNSEEANGRSWNNHNNTLYPELARGTPGQAWQRLKDAVRNAEDKNFILSAEGFYLINPSLLREALGRHETKVIVYLREFTQLFPSLYAQATKFGFNYYDFDTFLRTENTSQFFDISSRLERFADVFGPPNIVVRLLDKRYLVGGDVRLDFLSAIGIAGVNHKAFNLTNDQNISPDWKTLEIWRDINASLAERLISAHGGKAIERARAARNRRQPSPLYDYAAIMEPACAEIGKSLGWIDRGRYVSQEQFERWDREFGVIIDHLKAAGMSLSFDRSAPKHFAPREFLPSIEYIPADEAAEFMRRFSVISIWKLLDIAKAGAVSRLA